MRKKIISLIMAIVLSASLTLFPACEFIDSTLNNEQSSSQTSEDSSSESTSSSSENGCEEHTFGEWETVFEPLNCATIGEKQRICTKCNDVESEEILPAFSQHTFNENTLCTTCGHQEFIESEEYITVQKEAIANGMGYPYNLYNWSSVDGSYGLQIMSNPHRTFISGYLGTPVNIILPCSINKLPITSIGGGYGFGSRVYAFENCKTLESIFIPKNVDIEVAYPNHSFIGCSNLKYIYFPRVTNISTPNFKRILPNVKIIYYD